MDRQKTSLLSGMRIPIRNAHSGQMPSNRAHSGLFSDQSLSPDKHHQLVTTRSHQPVIVVSSILLDTEMTGTA